MLDFTRARERTIKQPKAVDAPLCARQAPAPKPPSSQPISALLRSFNFPVILNSRLAHTPSKIWLLNKQDRTRTKKDQRWEGRRHPMRTERRGCFSQRLHAQLLFQAFAIT
eukprot:2424452-Rhodomonas_salina.2